jgi:hypothetical protein
VPHKIHNFLKTNLTESNQCCFRYVLSTWVTEVGCTGWKRERSHLGKDIYMQAINQCWEILRAIGRSTRERTPCDKLISDLATNISKVRR